MEELRAAIVNRAIELGFDQVGFAPVDNKPTDIGSYERWLAEGRHGDMAFMENHVGLRHRPDTLEPGLRSAVVVTTNYHVGDDTLPGGLRIARYAQSEDYHRVLRKQLDALAAFITAESGSEVLSRPAVDTAPVLERELAVRAGLGWVGKNAMLIGREHGSFNFIAELFVDLPLAQKIPEPIDHCGSCSACIDVCPTGAIVSPYVIDARKCIAYLTIELRGPIPRPLRPMIGNYFFGCDLCQDVCPWNKKTVQQSRLFERRERLESLTPFEILTMSTERYQEVFRHSSMKRAKQLGLQRNAAVVIGNSDDDAHIDAIGTSFEGFEPLVRGHLAWTLGRLGASQILRQLTNDENDPYVLEEIRYATQMSQTDERM